MELRQRTDENRSVRRIITINIRLNFESTMEFIVSIEYASEYLVFISLWQPNCLFN